PNSTLMRVPWDSIDQSALDWATVFIAKTTQPSQTDSSRIDYRSAFHISLDDSQISGTCSIEDYFPACSFYRESRSPKSVWLNPLSRNSGQVVICIKQPAGNHLCLVFGFKARLNGAVDAKNCWFGKIPYSIKSQDIDE